MSSHSASSPYCAQYSRKASLVVEKETPNTIILAAASAGGPSAPGRPELGISPIIERAAASFPLKARSGIQRVESDQSRRAKIVFFFVSRKTLVPKRGRGEMNELHDDERRYNYPTVV